MGIFMELRCEGRGDGRDKYSGTRCISDDNNGPHSFCDDTLKSTSIGWRDIQAEAKADGWKKLKDGWVCPNCLKHEASLVEGNADGNS